jgi:hypothetical protein
VIRSSAAAETEGGLLNEAEKSIIVAGYAVRQEQKNLRVGTVINPGGSCTIDVQYNQGGRTATPTAHNSPATTGATSTPFNGPNFNGN